MEKENVSGGTLWVKKAALRRYRLSNENLRAGTERPPYKLLAKEAPEAVATTRP